MELSTEHTGKGQKKRRKREVDGGCSVGSERGAIGMRGGWAGGGRGRVGVRVCGGKSGR